jgi:hypothetical protein
MAAQGNLLSFIPVGHALALVLVGQVGKYLIPSRGEVE